MEKKLSVKNLVISFRTPGGKVQAVRNISFDLNKGETLAIVGESGSGKSVTSKAILGILAGNSIIESGSIIYDGMDLLKISEEEFYHIRGDKIAMIFQDPLSSLNPIMRIGKQLTEAMLLKGKARQKASTKAFNETLARYADAMVEACADKDAEKEKHIRQMCKNFDKFEFKHIELEQKYNTAHEAAIECKDELLDVIFHIEKNAFTDEKYTIKEIIRLAKQTQNDYVVCDDYDALVSLCDELKTSFKAEYKEKKYINTAIVMRKMVAILEKALDRVNTLEVDKNEIKKDQKAVPDFFSMGYYLTFTSQTLPEGNYTVAVNEMLKKNMEENFMKEFRGYVSKALEYSAQKHDVKKKVTCDLVNRERNVFACETPDRSVCNEAAKRLIASVMDSIDRLELVKDPVAYTFEASLKAAMNTYFEGIPKNKSAAKVHAKQQKKYDKLANKGKTPTWKVVPSQAVDLELAKENIVDVLDRLQVYYEERLNLTASRDYDKEAEDMIAFLKENASGSVLKITKAMAKYKALKLMEEVGIKDTRKRYKQYPFEFSGGMRQRIVIAIALAANPDILICDEPTTALDVTIQAQILELINKLKKERNLSIIFITHDLGVVANMADRIAVMYAGKIVETGTCDDIFYEPAHPYTWALLSAMPDVETNDRLEAIPGTPPNMIYPPVGDAFADRNKYALKIDFEKQPPMFDISETHKAATWLLHPDAPKVEMPQIITNRIERMKKKGGVNDGK